MGQDTMGLVHNGTRTKWDWATMELMHNGTGTRLDWDAVGRYTVGWEITGVGYRENYYTRGRDTMC